MTNKEMKKIIRSTAEIIRLYPIFNLSRLGSTIPGLLVAYAIFEKYFPYQVRHAIQCYYDKLMALFDPYVKITFPEYNRDGFQRSKAFSAIERYLNANATKQAKRLKASAFCSTEAIVLTMDNHQTVTDKFEGIKLWWTSIETMPNQQSIMRRDEKRSFQLTFHGSYREIITTKYLNHVLKEGKAIALKERRRKLYTNNKGDSRSMWSHVLFTHPATFDTLAMDPLKKQEIVDDLIRFTKSKDYYANVGKAWKRGYLLYGPPGTGKSTMIAAMANLLNYDVYDLELTSVKDNTELRKLLMDTSGKSIVVIEDIDCSLDLTGQRVRKKKENLEGEDDDKKKSSQVTLSGLLNFIDGLWSACGGERIIVFTTNYVEKLDPALIRRGRMDKHIELSYCGFEAFKVLAKNYLDTDSHDLFGEVRELLEETNMTPADVAENLMPKSGGENGETCLRRLIKALEEAKEEAREEQKQRLKKLTIEEDYKIKAEKLGKGAKA